MAWFRRGVPPQQTGVAMVGAKAGERVLFVGGDAPDLAAQVARVTGLNGRTLVLAREACARVERAAAEAGVLIDVDDISDGPLPIGDETFDIVVLTLGAADGDPAPLDVAREAFRIVRAGGRIVVRQALRRGGILRSGAGASSPSKNADPLDALLRAGAVAGRLLATVQGVSYYEGRRPRP